MKQANQCVQNISPSEVKITPMFYRDNNDPKFVMETRSRDD